MMRPPLFIRMMMPMTRGCGDRQDGGLYIEVETSVDGIPIEYFMLDPAIKWNGEVPIRAPMLIDGTEEGVKHIVLGVGKEHYPTVPDFVEEGAYKGVSKRIPRNFDLSALTPKKSRLLLMHPRAIPHFVHTTPARCISGLDKKEHTCVHDLWPLSALHPSTEKHTVDAPSPEDLDDGNDLYIVKLPSGYQYDTFAPYIPTLETFETEELKDQYHPGLFISLPIGKFVYVNKKDDTVPKEIKDKIKGTDFDLEVAKR